jgi:hypothetical protein
MVSIILLNLLKYLSHINIEFKHLAMYFDVFNELIALKVEEHWEDLE